MTGAALALILAAPARGSEFLDDLRRARARAAADPERVEFAARAIRAWRPGEPAELLAEARFLRGEGELAAWDDAAAEADLGAALAADPGDEKALVLRGRARLRRGRAREAEADFAAAAAARPDDGEAWLGLGESRAGEGGARSLSRAVSALAKADRLLPNDARPELALGRSYLSARRDKEALEALDAAVARGGPARPDSLLERARAKKGLGDPRGARADAGAAVEGLESRRESLRRSGAPARADGEARAELAAARETRAGAEETLGLGEDALADWRAACELGSEPACARADALAPKAAAPAPKPRKAPRRPNPNSEPGERVYAN